jgi:spermidine/putrescine ABC transporter ATP-binding subunit
MNELLILENITKYFGKHAAVNSVNLSIADGEFVTILGPSGSGKTTLLRIIAGFERPNYGSICYQGKDIVNTPVNERPFNTVFQDYALFPHMTVFNNIAYGLKVRRFSKSEIIDRVKIALEMVALTDYGERYPDQLSGGQRQRVALARALILQPKLLLLDEPLGALDLALRKKMQVTLKEIQEKVKITFIHVTHDQEEALSISDRIAIINEGAIKQFDNPEQIYKYPQNEFVAKFMGENNLLHGQLSSIGENEVTIKTELGEFKSLNNRLINNLRLNEPVTMVIRPENISVTTTDGNNLNCNFIDAIICRHIFIGAENLLLIKPVKDMSINLMVKIPSSYQNESINRSKVIRVFWEINSSWLIQCERNSID